MAIEFGPQWHRAQLPQDVAEKFALAVVMERRLPWLQLVHHHPIYYVDFPDLKKIIERKDNWTAVFCKLFGANKILFTGIINELEPLRNSIAHSRRISDASLDIIETAMHRLRTAVGADRFQALVASDTIAPDVHAILASLRNEAEIAATAMRRCEPGLALKTWAQAKDQWWFEDAYLSSELEPIRAFFSLAASYGALTRSMGDGYATERWLADRRFQDLETALRLTWDQLNIPETTV
jgi:hypothetical protein